MPNKYLFFVLIALVLAAAAAAGLYWLQGARALESAAQNALPPQVSNDPASVFCGTLKGTVTVKKVRGVEVGVCNLPDGRSCEKEAFAKDNTCNAI